MRLYHLIKLPVIRYVTLFFLSVFIWGCSATQATPLLETVNILADGKQLQTKIPAGTTVLHALGTSGIALGDSDRVDPSLDSIVVDGMQIKVIRVKDEFYVEQVPIPFEHQELKNEALPEGERRLSQPGENGLQEITYHRVYEDNVQVSNTVEKNAVVKEAIPEIVMVGIRATFAPIKIPGKIAYLSAGNAWILETSTGNRNCVVCTGDLDGRIFSLSPDGNFLLFTRFSNQDNTINSLWSGSLKSDPAKLIELGVNNVVNYAEFDPDSNIVAYSTAEWREAAPGWQANNDLYELGVSATGYIGKPEQIIEANSGGVYGWWGTVFSWAPIQPIFAYSQPDSVGILEAGDGSQTTLLTITPYQTEGYWAWVPGISWSPDGKILYTVSHNINSNSPTENVDEFDLIGMPLTGGGPIPLVRKVGMFAYPAVSPVISSSTMVNNAAGETTDQETFTVAYLQAVFTDQSQTSHYRVCLIDRDGSNQRSIFPAEGMLGLDPQHVAWSPDRLQTDGEYAIGVIYNGNIWIIHTESGTAQQITGDGLTSKIDWR